MNVSEFSGLQHLLLLVVLLFSVNASISDRSSCLGGNIEVEVTDDDGSLIVERRGQHNPFSCVIKKSIITTT
jgi:hypothetical protein